MSSEIPVKKACTVKASVDKRERRRYNITDNSSFGGSYVQNRYRSRRYEYCRRTCRRQKRLPHSRKGKRSHGRFTLVGGDSGGYCLPLPQALRYARYGDLGCCGDRYRDAGDRRERYGDSQVFLQSPLPQLPDSRYDKAGDGSRGCPHRERRERRRMG